MNKSNYSDKTIFSNSSKVGSNKEYLNISKFTGLNKLSSFNNRIRYYGLHQKKVAKKFCSKMAVSVVISRKPQAPIVHFANEQNEGFSKQFLLDIPSFQNTQLIGTELHKPSQQFVYGTSNDSRNFASYNTGHYKPRLSGNKYCANELRASESSHQNSSEREIACHQLLFSERRSSFEEKMCVSKNRRCTMTSESFLPTYLETVQNDTHLLPPPKSYSTCSASDDKSEIEDNDFVLNISKTSNDNYISALDLFRRCQVPLNHSSVTQASLNVPNFDVENCDKKSKRYTSPMSTVKSECDSDDCSDCSSYKENVSVDVDTYSCDVDDVYEEDYYYSSDYEEENKGIETTINEYLHTKSQMILHCSKTVLESEFINEESLDADCSKNEDLALEGEMSDDSYSEE